MPTITSSRDIRSIRHSDYREDDRERRSRVHARSGGAPRRCMSRMRASCIQSRPCIWLETFPRASSWTIAFGSSRRRSGRVLCAKARPHTVGGRTSPAAPRLPQTRIASRVPNARTDPDPVDHDPLSSGPCPASMDVCGPGRSLWWRSWRWSLPRCRASRLLRLWCWVRGRSRLTAVVGELLIPMRSSTAATRAGWCRIFVGHAGEDHRRAGRARTRSSDPMAATTASWFPSSFALPTGGAAARRDPWPTASSTLESRAVLVVDSGSGFCGPAPRRSAGSRLERPRGRAPDGVLQRRRPLSPEPKRWGVDKLGSTIKNASTGTDPCDRNGRP
jgi:hypothetical protein